MSEKWVKNIQNGGHSKNPKVRGCSSCNIWRLMTGPEKCKWSVNILSIVHSPIRHLHDDVIWLQLPECFEASVLYSVFFFCEESLVRDTNLHYKDYSEMHSGSCSQMTSSCQCPLVLLCVCLFVCLFVCRSVCLFFRVHRQLIRVFARGIEECEDTPSCTVCRRR